MMNASQSQSPVRPARRGSARSAFTLTEVLIATTILGMAMSMTMVVYLAALKRANHTELALKGTAELRYATDIISQTVRSASQLPTIQSSGLKLLVPPKDAGFATVLETTWIDQPGGVKGSKSNQRMLHVSNVGLPIVVLDLWSGSSRPSGAIANSDVATYFRSDLTNVPVVDLNDLFASGDTITIPATAYGPEVTRVINNISNNSGNKTLTLTANLGVDVPNGTKIAASSGRRAMFEVVATGASTGDLRYYPDSRNTNQYTVLARDIDPTPLSDPSDSTSAVTVPFTISNTSTNYVTLNLQKVPRGTTTGRTLQGVRTTVYTRNSTTGP